MKTNASPKTIVKAVENVSASKYENNVIFRKYPEKLTKNVNRFTVRTIDANKIGSMETKTGQKQPKANWNVHQDIMNEIFRLDPRPNTYVDTIYGRQHNPNPVQSTEQHQTEPMDAVDADQPRLKRKYTKRKGNKQSRTVNTLIEAIKYVAAHPELIRA